MPSHDLERFTGNRRVPVDIPRELNKHYHKHMARNFQCGIYRHTHNMLEFTYTFEAVYTNQWKQHGPPALSLDETMRRLQDQRLLVAENAAIDRVLEIRGVWGRGVRSKLEDQKIANTGKINGIALLLIDFSPFSATQLDNMLATCSILEDYPDMESWTTRVPVNP